MNSVLGLDITDTLTRESIIELSSNIISIQDDILTINDILDTKLDITDYTLSNQILSNLIDEKVSFIDLDVALLLKADVSFVNTEIANLDSVKADKLNTYTKFEIDTSLSSKANVIDVYNKDDIDTFLTFKADKASTYTKIETDTLLDTKVATTTFNNTLLNYSTTTEINTALATKAPINNPTFTGSIVSIPTHGNLITKLSDIEGAIESLGGSTSGSYSNIINEFLYFKQVRTNTSPQTISIAGVNFNGDSILETTNSNSIPFIQSNGSYTIIRDCKISITTELSFSHTLDLDVKMTKNGVNVFQISGSNFFPNTIYTSSTIITFKSGDSFSVRAQKTVTNLNTYTFNTGCKITLKAVETIFNYYNVYDVNNIVDNIVSSNITPIIPLSIANTIAVKIINTALTDLSNQIDVIKKNNVPVGCILMWSGSSVDVPFGWAICDGTTVNGYTTPDLRGRFIICASGGYEQGTTGGAMTATLSVANIPSHTHTGTTAGAGQHNHSFNFSTSGGSSITPGGDNSGANNRSASTSTVGNHTHTFTTNATGGGTAFSIVPLYYSLIYIMKV
jgi:microcystin-dependent protein